MTNDTIGLFDTPNFTNRSTETSSHSVDDVTFQIKDRFYSAGYVIVPVVFIVGLLGNILTVVTMRSKELKTLAVSYTLVALAISDSTMLVCQLLNKEFVRKLLSFDPRAVSDLGCKIFFHIYRTGKMTSSWLIVLICFERYIAVVHPLKARRILTKKNIRFSIASIYFVIIAYNGVWTFSSSAVNGICQQYAINSQNKELNRYFLIAGSLLYSLIPMFLLGAFTPRIIFMLVWQRRLKNRLAPKSTEGGTQSKAGRISVMLIGVMVAYVILILPITIYHNLNAWKDSNGFDPNTEVFFILKQVAQIMEQLNHAANFYLYVLCSKQFRQQVFLILHLQKCLSKGHDPISTNQMREIFQSTCSNKITNSPTEENNENTANSLEEISQEL